MVHHVPCTVDPEMMTTGIIRVTESRGRNNVCLVSAPRFQYVIHSQIYYIFSIVLQLCLYISARPTLLVFQNSVPSKTLILAPWTRKNLINMSHQNQQCRRNDLTRKVFRVCQTLGSNPRTCGLYINTFLIPPSRRAQCLSERIHSRLSS